MVAGDVKPNPEYPTGENGLSRTCAKLKGDNDSVDLVEEKSEGDPEHKDRSVNSELRG